MKIYVLTPQERPDFRLVTTFLWHDHQNVDTGGNSYNPASREWTELTITNRENEEERVDVDPAQTEPLILQVESRLDYIAARTAYFLASHTGGSASASLAREYEHCKYLLDLIGDFDVEAAMQRVEASPFGRATLDDPYPNQRDDLWLLENRKRRGR